jgi:hypothetical protein
VAYAQFRELWDSCDGDGMRRDLVELSFTPIANRPGVASGISAA